MSENPVKRAIIQELIDTGFLVLRINSGRDARRFFYYVKWFLGDDNANTAGCFDIIALRRGDFALAVDAKAPGKLAEVSEAQKRFMAAWRAAGGVAIVADSVELFRAELKRVMI